MLSDASEHFSTFTTEQRSALSVFKYDTKSFLLHWICFLSLFIVSEQLKNVGQTEKVTETILAKHTSKTAVGVGFYKSSQVLRDSGQNHTAHIQLWCPLKLPS